MDESLRGLEEPGEQHSPGLSGSAGGISGPKRGRAVGVAWGSWIELGDGVTDGKVDQGQSRLKACEATQRVGHC